MPRGTRQSCGGFTVVELLIGMSLALLIVGGMWLALQSLEGAYQAQAAGREARLALEGAVKQLQTDLQQAGAGLPLGSLPALTPGSRDRNPIVTIRYLTKAPVVTRLTAPASERAKLFRIVPDDIRYFRRGDQVLIRHGDTWQLFRVDAVGSHSSPRLTLEAERLPGAEDRTVWLTFPVGSEVARLRDAEVQYALAPGPDGQRRLLRRHGGQTTVVATGIRDLRFDYLVTPIDNDETAPAWWTTEPPPQAPIIGTRVHLAIGQSTTHFTFTSRNLVAQSPGALSLHDTSTSRNHRTSRRMGGRPRHMRVNPSESLSVGS